jgi:hypothetical protein
MSESGFFRLHSHKEYIIGGDFERTKPGWHCTKIERCIWFGLIVYGRPVTLWARFRNWLPL